MEKIAFVFPGQGAQFIGMSKSLFDNYAAARQTFEEANDTLGFDLSDLCFNGSLLELNKLENMFPAIVISSIATLRVFMNETGVAPQFCTGHSLGEYSALTCSGALKFCDAVNIARLRGFLFQEIADSAIGAMTVIDGIDKGVVEKACREISDGEQGVWVSCCNSFSQTVVSGHTPAVMKLEDRMMECGGSITPFIGGAPLHSPLMQPAADKLRKELEKYTFGQPSYPVISNYAGGIYAGKESIAEMLVQQITHPVQWHESVNYMVRKGVTLAIEMGPKDVLCSLTEGCSDDIFTACYGQKEDRQKLRELFSSDGDLKKLASTVVTKCLTAAVSTPNGNFNENEYYSGVIEPYKKIQAIQQVLEEGMIAPTAEQMADSLNMLFCIFNTKKLPLEEQREWFNHILDETGSRHLLKDFKIP